MSSEYPELINEMQACHIDSLNAVMLITSMRETIYAWHCFEYLLLNIT